MGLVRDSKGTVATSDRPHSGGEGGYTELVRGGDLGGVAPCSGAVSLEEVALPQRRRRGPGECGALAAKVSS